MSAPNESKTNDDVAVLDLDNPADLAAGVTPATPTQPQGETKQSNSNDDDDASEADTGAPDTAATDADNSATDANSDDDDNDSSDNDSDNDSDPADTADPDQASNGDDEEDSDEESNSSDEDMDDGMVPEEKVEVKEVVQKKKGFFSRLRSKAVVESSSSSSEESEDSVDLDEIDAETLEEAIEALKLIEEVDSDWDILLDAPSDWDSDDSENKPTAPIFRSTCGYLTMETTQLREDLLNDLLESRVLLKDAAQELKTTEDDQYMMYYYDTISKLRSTKDKAAKRVNDEENRLALYSQKDEGVTRLASALRFNEHLVSLTLCDAEMTSAAAISLASAIKVHPTLTHLSCKHNPIGAEGAEALFRASRRNGVGGLQELDLWDCNIGPEGALMIATQLYKDTTLKEVRLRYNQFGSIGGFAFAGCLMQNRTLVKLDLSLNDIGMNGALAFERVLKFTVVVQMEENIKLSPYKKACKLCRERIDDPYWDEKRLAKKAIQDKLEKKAAKLAAKAAKRKGKSSKVEGGEEDGEEGEGDEGGEGGDGEEGDESGEGEQKENGAESSGSDDGEGETKEQKEKGSDDDDSEEEEEEEEDGNDDDAGTGETKAPRREGRRARRKRLKEEALAAKRVAANNKFWMASYLSTKEDLAEQKTVLFSTKTKKRIYNLVLFAGTSTQCSKAMELMSVNNGIPQILGLSMAKPNFVIKEVGLESNNFERPFRNNINSMKRLLGSRLTGTWDIKCYCTCCAAW